MAGIGTRFESFEAGGGRVDGLVVRTDTGLSVDGKVLVSVMPRLQDDERTEPIWEAELVDGRFRVEVGDVHDALIQAHYLGRFPYGPCDSQAVDA